MNISITHAELRTAINDKKGKPIFFYVRDQVWQEYQLWKENPQLKYKADHKVFEMISEYDGTKKWIESFRDSVELKHKLLRRLQLT